MAFSCCMPPSAVVSGQLAIHAHGAISPKATKTFFFSKIHWGEFGCSNSIPVVAMHISKTRKGEKREKDQKSGYERSIGRQQYWQPLLQTKTASSRLLFSLFFAIYPIGWLSGREYQKKNPTQQQNKTIDGRIKRGWRWIQCLNIWFKPEFKLHPMIQTCLIWILVDVWRIVWTIMFIKNTL